MSHAYRRICVLAGFLIGSIPAYAAVFQYDFDQEGGADLRILSNASRDNISKALHADLNGDGIDEIIVFGDADYGHGIAKFNVLWGRRDWGALPRTIDLATTRGALYVQSLSVREFAWTGFQTHVMAGDFNGDGKDDVAFGGFNNDLGGQDAGAVYVLFGRTEYVPNVRNFTPADFDVTYTGTGGQLGKATALADVNGDGIGDLAALAPGQHKVFCVFGPPEIPADKRVRMEAANADLVFQGGNIQGQLLTLGDFNNDGRADFAFGSEQTILIYFTTDELIAQHVINTETTTPTVRIVNRPNLILRAGDMNQDGRDDLIGLANETAYVVFGRDWTPGSILDAGGLKPDIVLTVSGSSNEAGSLDLADFDGDSYDDLLVHEGHGEKSWVIFSRPDFPPNDYRNLASNPERADLYYRSRYSMDAAGDFDGNGVADLVVPSWTEYNDYGGIGYIIFTLPMVKQAALSPAPLLFGQSPQCTVTKQRMTTGVRYQWLRNGEPIPGATSSSLPSEHLMVGDRVGCVVTPEYLQTTGPVFTVNELVVQPDPNATSDLQAQNLDFSPIALNPGDTLHMSGQILNVSTEQTSHSFWVEFLAQPLFEEGGWFYLCDSMLVRNLAPNAAVDLGAHPRTVYDLPRGVYDLAVRIDPLNEVSELDEQNNFVLLPGKRLNIGYVLGVSRWALYE